MLRAPAGEDAERGPAGGRRDPVYALLYDGPGVFAGADGMEQRGITADAGGAQPPEPQ